MITYNKFPALLFCSYNKDNAPDALPIEITDKFVLSQIQKNESVMSLLPQIAVLNSKGGQPTHYFLSDMTFQKVEYSNVFRNQNFTEFFEKKMESKYGTICFADGGQYVYNYDATTGHLTTMLLRENLFVGFEEAKVVDGLQVYEGGIYLSGMDVGGYLSFVIIALNHLRNSSKEVDASYNQTTERIYC